MRNSTGLRIFLLGACVSITQVCLARDPLRLGQLKIDKASGPCFEKVELTFDLNEAFNNPFDPRQIAADASFRAPAGAVQTVPAFLNQEFRRRLDDNGVEIEEPIGPPVWTVRFAPAQPGRWTVKLTARTPDSSATSAEARFDVTAGASHGYIRRAENTRYFAFDDGTPFFPAGVNIAWAGRRGNATYDYDRWVTALAKGGGNLARIWLQWNKALSIEYNGERSGSGRYDLVNAWRMDYVLDLCRRNGVKVQFTLDSPEPYTYEEWWLGRITRKPWASWVQNAANGGTLNTPDELFTTEEGARLIEQRLRYVVARWGWDPNIFNWEIWNELDMFGRLHETEWLPIVPDMVKWHKRIAKYLRSIDSGRHLVTLSFAKAHGQPEIWKIPELDFVQSHSYQSTDLGGTVAELTRDRLRFDSRPYLIGEFGTRLDWLSKVPTLDPEAVHVRNGMWSSVMAGGAGAAMFWDWELPREYMERIYGYYGSLARFVEGIPWTTRHLRPANLAVLLGPGNWAAPDIRAIGLIGDGLALVWLQNKANSIQNIADKKPISPAEGAQLVVDGVPPEHRCKMEWWDTKKGEITRTEQATASAGGLIVHVPALPEDVALKLRW